MSETRRSRISKSSRAISFNIEQMYAVLKAMPAIKTRVMYCANLSWEGLVTLLDAAECLGLCRQGIARASKIMRSTQGDNWVSLYEQLIELSGGKQFGRARVLAVA